MTDELKIAKQAFEELMRLGRDDLNAAIKANKAQRTTRYMAGWLEGVHVANRIISEMIEQKEKETGYGQ